MHSQNKNSYAVPFQQRLYKFRTEWLSSSSIYLELICTKASKMLFKIIKPFLHFIDYIRSRNSSKWKLDQSTFSIHKYSNIFSMFI